MSASLTPSSLSSKLTEVADRVRERCRTLEDTLDSWIALGRDLDQLACAWVSEQDAQLAVKMQFRKRSGTKPEGLRKRCIAYLVCLVQETGFNADKVNRALQYYALEQSAAWIQQLKSEGKARELKSLAKWHWEGCKLTREGERSLKAIHGALTANGQDLSHWTVKEIRDIVRGILGRLPKAKNPARAAAQAFFTAIEGSDSTPPADKAEVLSWLAVLLRESPLAAEILTEAVETHLE